MKFNITTILLVIAIVFVTLQVESCFHNSKPNSEYKKEIADKDKQIDDVKKELSAVRGKNDSLISILMKKDTVLITKLVSNDKKQQNIITVVRDASKDELRRFVTEY